MIVREYPDFLPTAEIGLPIFGYVNFIKVQNIYSSSEDLDFPATNLANPATHLKWKESSQSPMNDAYLTMINDSNEDINFVGIAKHNLGSSGVIVSVEIGSGSPISFTEIVSHQPVDDAPIIFHFSTQAGAPAIRIHLDGGTNLREIGSLYIGKTANIERSMKVDVTHIPINMGRHLNSVNGMSESANFVGRIIKSQFNETIADFSYLTKTAVDNLVDNILPEIRANPFFWAWSPDEFPQGVGYCWLVNDSIPEFEPMTQRYHIKFGMRGIS